ncbi:MAG: tRNA threonylcarbamoyladenosine dehydratase, partial [Oscillospiraceae bacterium]|nr:tRNA threonylcarbamoyladenosine dehydratase [Oscillospiraceae bacterium]
SYTAEALARAGVGRLMLVDGDTVADSNRNRQLCALTSTVGQQKAAVMAARIKDINPGCVVQAYPLFYDAGSDSSVLDGLDYIADAIDTVTSKLLLARQCRDHRIPLISAMGCGNKRDPGRFRITDIYDTRVCPLCRVMRRELRAQGIDSLRVVWSDEPPVETGERLPGSISFVPAAAGLIMAGEIVNSLTGK